MLKDCIWSKDRDYKSGSEDEPLQFYLDGLANSTEFHLLLGYFSSSAISLLSLGFATFISNGGKMRLVINHMLSSKDKQMLEQAQNYNGSYIFDLTDIVNLKNILSKYDSHFFECLAYLIAQKRIEIKIIKPKSKGGISHYKSGVFVDGKDTVSYKASCNFTLYGLAGNLEELQAFLSWDNDQSNQLIQKQLRLIEDYFKEVNEDVEYVPISNIEQVILENYGNKSIDELLVQEDQLLIEQNKICSNPRLKKSIDTILRKITLGQNSPKFPFPDGPRNYQLLAYKNWTMNNCQGMFVMATGTGKTITSLNCLLENYKQHDYYKAMILVPTKSLVEQWEKECRKFNFTENLILVYSQNNWESDLSRLETLELLNKKLSFIIIATYASFVTSKFQKYLLGFKDDVLLIADECHNLGTHSVMKKINNIKLKQRIGLSATPERQYQEDINSSIRHFFGEQFDDSYVFTYSMEEAIRREPKALCPYRYYPVIVRLTDEEFRKYVEFTRKIISINPKTEEEKEIFNRLCIARQRIIHKAENKLEAFKKILKIEYSKRKNLKYTLVYVPEGLSDEEDSLNFHKIDNLVETDADRVLLNKYTKVIGDLFADVSVKQFTANTPGDDRKLILDNFSNGNLQVITSMKCLDEGIDVPRAELAIFCSSTGNPRQFIQRRGRVLRLAPEKDESTIYDMVVIPERSGQGSLFKIEQSEIEKELKRIRDFADLSENKHYTRELLDPILKYYQLNL